LSKILKKGGNMKWTWKKWHFLFTKLRNKG